MDFPAPTTPLANIFFSFFILISKDIIFLRLINLILSLFCIFIFVKIIKEYDIKDSFKILTFAIFPYFLILSQIVMTDIFALLMCLISVYFFKKFEKFNKKKFLLISSFFSCLSFFSRQYYIFIPISHIIYLLSKNKKYIFYYFIFLIPIFFYIFLQKGLTPIEFKKHYNIETFPIKFFILSSIGFYFLPQISKIKMNKTKIFSFLFLILFGILGIFQINCYGISCKLTNNFLIGVIFSFVGILIIHDFMKNRIKDYTTKIYLILFIIEQCFNSMQYERYFLSIYWVFIIFSDKKLTKIQFIYLLIISIVYILYKTILT